MLTRSTLIKTRLRLGLDGSFMICNRSPIERPSNSAWSLIALIDVVDVTTDCFSKYVQMLRQLSEIPRAS